MIEQMRATTVEKKIKPYTHIYEQKKRDGSDSCNCVGVQKVGVLQS
jgi:hypothetical protein